MMATKKKLKLKKKYKFSLLLIAILVVGIIIANNKYQQHLYEQTYEYQLQELGYDKLTITTFLDKLSEDKIKFILMSPKSDDFYNIITQKYYLDKNFNAYYEYKKENKSKSYSDVIALINTHANTDWYDKTYETDIKKKNTTLVNKFYYLDANYIPENIVKIGLTYAYADNSCTEETYLAFKDMFYAAKEQNLNLIINSSYRSYQDQEATYDTYRNYYGISYADSVAARKGHSEHQTGLALDIFSPGASMENFHETEEYKWLQNNSYKYGFILRYPENKEYITGFKYESWHYRYVGIEVATKIHNENITFDEYYAYYLAK